MENKIYYTAIKETIDYYRTKENSEDGFYLVKRELDKFEVKDIEQYYENVDYRKIFWRSYYRRFLDTSPSFDFDGKEIHWKSRFVAEIMLTELKRLVEDRTPINKYLHFGNADGDISDAKYQELLEEHDLL